MPIHIYGAGGSSGGGSTKNALAMYFTLENEQSHTFIIDDIEFAQSFNASQKTKVFELVLEGNIATEERSKRIVYRCCMGVVDGADVSKEMVFNNSGYMSGSGLALWDGGFTISGNSASFTVSLISGISFAANRVHRATWICEE